MLRTRDLTYAYPGSPPLRFPDLDFARGESGLVLGESGCGKTTLLHLLGGLRRPASGRVEIDGQDLASMKGADRDRFRGRRVGIVFQTPHFARALTLAENLLLARRLAGETPDRSAVYEVLDRLGLAVKIDVKPGRLSEGERQRAALARAVINRPAVILADEPTSALDDRHTAAVADLLAERAGDIDASLVIVTHDARLKSRFPRSVGLATPLPA